MKKSLHFTFIYMKVHAYKIKGNEHLKFYMNYFNKIFEKQIN